MRKNQFTMYQSSKFLNQFTIYTYLESDASLIKLSLAKSMKKC